MLLWKKKGKKENRMKLWKWMKKCPILFLMLAGWGALAVFTWTEGKMPSSLEMDMIENPVFTALLKPEVDIPQLNEIDLGLDLENKQTDRKDGQQPGGKNGDSTDLQENDKSQANGQADEQKGTEKTDSTKKDTEQKNNTGQTEEKTETKDKPQTNEKSANGQSVQEEIGVTKYRKYKKQQIDSPYYSDSGKIALTTEYGYKHVKKDYFDDAVFIGDSRTVGMQDYSGLDNATFFAKTGMNVYELLDDAFLADPKSGKDVSISYMLKNHTYRKIYLMVGINELGTGNTGTFQNAYAGVLQKIRKWQPDAVIYIQGIIPVSKEKASNDGIFNNININDKNVAISQLADGKDVFYLDVSEKLVDKSGYLKDDYTFDEVHMYAQYYQLWTDYLMEHAVVR